MTNLPNVLAIARNDLRLLWRDKLGLFWIIAFPLVFALFFGAIFGGSGDDGVGAMTVIAVDQDESDGSTAFIESLQENDAIFLKTATEGGAPYTRDEARDIVRRGNAVAYVLVPEGYDQGAMSMFAPDGPELEVGIDPARTAEAGFLRGMLTQASFARMQDMFTDPASALPNIDEIIADIETESDMPADQQETLTTFMRSFRTFMDDVDVDSLENDNAPSFEPAPIKTESVTRESSGPQTAFAISFPQAMVWGVMGCAAGFAISLVQERTRGTELRLLVAPNAWGHILAGKGLACFFMCCLTLTILTLVGAIFGVRLSNPIGWVMAVVCSSACFTGIMMLLSTLGKTEQAVAGAGWVAMMPFAMLGGGMVPLMVMPDWMRSLSNISPVKWVVLSLEGAIWRGFTIGEMLLPCGILLAVGAGAFFVGVQVLRRRGT